MWLTVYLVTFKQKLKIRKDLNLTYTAEKNKKETLEILIQCPIKW